MIAVLFDDQPEFLGRFHMMRVSRADEIDFEVLLGFDAKGGKKLAELLGFFVDVCLWVDSLRGGGFFHFLTAFVGACIEENVKTGEFFGPSDDIGADEFDRMADMRVGIDVRQCRRYVERFHKNISL